MTMPMTIVRYFVSSDERPIGGTFYVLNSWASAGASGDGRQMIWSILGIENGGRRQGPMKLSKEARQERAQRSHEWKRFRNRYLLSQEKLAEGLGVSRRCVIYIENGQVKPAATTMRLFQELKAKYERRTQEMRPAQQQFSRSA
jgi:DNA-binding XRE family transcriptional regulator